MNKIYVKLYELVEITSLRRGTIKRLVKEGKIPVLKLSGRYYFNLTKILQALDKLEVTENYGKEARKITANVKESTKETLKAVRAGNYER